MAFPAHVLRLVVASSGNVSEELGVVFEESCRWNDAYSGSRRLMLHPVRFSSHPNGASPHAAPSRVQHDETDILIGIFGTGSGTQVEDSGAVDAIKRHVSAGKTAAVFFFDPMALVGQNDLWHDEALQSFRDECGVGGLSAAYSNVDAFRVAFRKHLTRELDHLRYVWLPEPVPPAQKVEPGLSAEASRMLAAAAASQGVINMALTLGHEVIQAGRVTLSDGTPRKTALLKDALRELTNLGIMEPDATRPGIYRLTGLGYRAADKLIEEQKAHAEPEHKPRPTPKVQPFEHASYRPARH
ncbi:MAG: hypothetical protein WAL45_07295 [Terracidiphilus sp.]